MNLDLSKILYLAFRMGPFILVSYFMLSSLFLQDFKSLIYLAGLLLACFISTLVGNLFTNNLSENGICSQITLSGGTPLSNIPLSLTVYSFTLFYLLYAILNMNVSKDEKDMKDTEKINNTAALNNLPVLILFPLLIVADFLWLLSWNCSPFLNMVISIVFGGATGLAWAAIISNSKMAPLLYLTVMSNSQVCSRPAKTRMMCKKRKPTSD